MSFDLSFHNQNSGDTPIKLAVGEKLFILGANGTGKSSLILHFSNQNYGKFKKISAHRQNWLSKDDLDMTPVRKSQAEQQINATENNKDSRYRDQFGAARASITIFDLIAADNARARAIAAAVDAKDEKKISEASKELAPIAIINRLFSNSGIAIEIVVSPDGRIWAKRCDGEEYSAAALSDGERNALLIAGSVLNANKNTLIIIDEPERHLHRSIIAPLLNQLFDQRPDCGFVISTHDHDLPLATNGARILLLRSCSFSNGNAYKWDADELAPNAPIADDLKKDLLGARRSILFVEGTESSLDKSLYSIIFPMASIVPKGSCRDVEAAVIGSRSVEDFHWLRAYGIADGDAFSEEQIVIKRERGIYTLPYYSVEAIYFHTKIIEFLAVRQADNLGFNAENLQANAIEGALSEVDKHVERLVQNAVKKNIRKIILDQIPNDNDLLRGDNLIIVNDSCIMHRNLTAEVKKAISNSDWDFVLQHCNVRDCGALNAIAAALKFRAKEDYQSAVRQLLVSNQMALTWVRGLFGEIFEKLAD